ncbi:hypothetical protein PYV02_06795 [Leifsonia sp. H3M29-4]|uniref:hypothetical protein n=1 Tax=Salinibacterium metalliresistens TaxID=3031321 RepID=UPI0023DCC6C6|nr:hypothetical protein [Salinibacterium metalliresistens]MDF1478791.1 hypothetical protein [Salinibacterium metalliresistens]
MTELAYMVRSDWAQRGTAMEPQSAVIRDWLGDAPYLFAAPDLKKHETENDADREFVDFVAPDPASRRVFALSELGQLRRSGDDELGHAVMIIHPYKEKDCELLREIILAGRVARIFVIIWARADDVCVMLDGLGAVDLDTGESAPPLDPVQLEAAVSMVDEQYNGLGSGRGKDAVIQLLRAFTKTGYPLDEEAWLRAFYAAGGEFEEALKIGKFIKEMQKGVKHRVKQRFVPEIVDVLRARVAEKANAS